MHTEMDKDLTQAGDDDVDAEEKQLRHKVEGEFFCCCSTKICQGWSQGCVQMENGHEKVVNIGRY